MTPKRMFLLRLAVTLMGATAWPLLAQQTPVFRVTTDTVAVDVSVTRSRVPVTGLTAADFALTDNGVRQQIDDVLTGSEAIDVTVLLGGGHLNQQKKIAQSAIELLRLQALLGPGDRLRVIEGSTDAREIAAMAPATAPVAVGNFADRVRVDEYVWSELPWNDALFYAIAWPAVPGRRHLVVAFTSAIDVFSTTTNERIVQIAERSDAVLHAVIYSSPSSDLRESDLDPKRQKAWQESYAALTEAVRRTGGELHRAKSGVDEFKQILSDFHSSYLLRYTPRGVPAAGWHELKVSVTKPGSFAVRARKGYERR